MYPTCHAVPFTPAAIGSDRACTSAAVCRLANPSGCGAHNTGSVPLEQSPLNHERVWLSVALFAGPEFEELERVGDVCALRASWKVMCRAGTAGAHRLLGMAIERSRRGFCIRRLHLSLQIRSALLPACGPRICATRTSRFARG